MGRELINSLDSLDSEGVTAKTQVGRGNACKSVGSSNPLASLLVLIIGQDLGDGRLLF